MHRPMLAVAACLLFAAALVGCGSSKPAAPPTPNTEATREARAGTAVVIATADAIVAEAKATKAAEPTDTPEPTDEPTEPPATAAPIHLEGRGQTATDPVELPIPVGVAELTHDGRRNFIVKMFKGDGSEDIIANAIGPYTGEVLVTGNDTLTFDVNADGNWTIDLRTVGLADGPPFSGKGDMVSGFFDPPSGAGPWVFNHDGQRNFIVKLDCVGGADIVQNKIGVVSDASGIVSFPDGPCVWTVKADGNWSLAPRE